MTRVRGRIRGYTRNVALVAVLKVAADAAVTHLYRPSRTCPRAGRRRQFLVHRGDLATRPSMTPRSVMCWPTLSRTLTRWLMRPRMWTLLRTRRQMAVSMPQTPTERVALATSRRGPRPTRTRNTRRAEARGMMVSPNAQIARHAPAARFL